MTLTSHYLSAQEMNTDWTEITGLQRLHAVIMDMPDIRGMPGY